MRYICYISLITLTLFLAGTASAAYKLPKGAGSEIIYDKCQACHGLGFIVEGNYTKDQWIRIIEEMKGMGLNISKDEEEKAIEYLSTHLGAPTKAVSKKTKVHKKEVVAVKEEINKGKELYDKKCAFCHRKSGVGIEDVIPPLAGNKIITKDRLYNIYVLLYGIKGEIEVNGRRYNNSMPNWSGMKDEEIAEVINYYIASWGNKGFTPISAKEITKVRGMKKGPQDVLSYRKTLR